jgi:hypothetical protein
LHVARARRRIPARGIVSHGGLGVQLSAIVGSYSLFARRFTAPVLFLTVLLSSATAMSASGCW